MDNKKTKAVPGAGILTALRENVAKFISGYITITGSPQEKRAEINRRLNYAARGTAYGVLAFLYGSAQAAFGTYPLGGALLASSASYVPFIYIGLITSALFNKGQAIAMFLMYTMGGLLRLLSGYWLRDDKKKPLFNEPVSLRIAIGISMSFMIGIYRTVSGGFLYYDLFGTVLGIVLTPLLIFAFCGVLEKKNRFTSYYDVGIAIFLAATVYSLNNINIFGFSISAIAAFIITLYVSKEFGMLRGGIIGLFCGLAFNIMYAPLFAIGGLVSGLFWKVGTAAATAAACITGIIYGVYLDGFTTLRQFAPDLLAASIVFSPLAHFGILPKPSMYGAVGTVPDRFSEAAIVAKKQQESSITKFQAMSDAFTALSEVFYNLSDRLRRPGIYEVRLSCEKSFQKYCEVCSKNSLCWENEYTDTVDAINKISMQLFRTGHTNRENLPEHIGKRCHKLDSVLSEINLCYSKLFENTLKQNKTEVFAMDYEAMSKLLEEAIAQNTGEFEIDEKLTKKMRAAIRYLDLTAANVAVYGSRRKNIIAGGIDLARVKYGAEELRHSFERVCGVHLDNPIFSIDSDYITMSLKSARSCSPVYARASSVKENEEINGDSIIAFENKEDYFYTLLSDGMGSGREAALTSRLCAVFLEKMLRAGNNKAVTLEMLNNFIRSKNTESFATIDLLEIDLLSREASFVKSGAAPSYILRSGSLFKIASNSMPIGITREINAEEVKFALEEGDIIVMISDGIAQSFEDGVWLADMLINDWKEGISLSEMSEKILTTAKDKNKRSDDMTVGIVKINSV